MTNKITTRETRNVTAKELAQRFEGKYVDIEPYDRYGMSVTMIRATIEYEEDGDGSELWFVGRDSEDRATGTICFDVDSIESIETDDNNSFVMEFIYDMTGVDISEYKTLEELQKEQARKNFKVVK